MSKTFYLTTPIYYVNSTPHVGHALTMLVCDATKRFHVMRGEQVKFLTGTDENGLKIIEAAEAAGEAPQAFVDRICKGFEKSWALMNFAYDDFIRTTEPRHVTAVQSLFSLLRDSGHIYLDKYEGWYDVSAETFVREADLVDGKSPDGNEVRWVSEENHFFRLSAFGDRLLEHIEANPMFLLPAGRRAEVVSFIKQGLRDICITRNNPGWGIPVPGEPEKVVYVWFDALVNYLAATGWPDTSSGSENVWPADIHWMAKEIFTRFHATLWPAMLMAANLPLPKTVIAHGWFTFNDSKMSKSKGNVLTSEVLVDFFETRAGCTHDLAVDALRHCLVRSLPYENDTNFTRTEVYRLYNADLANDLGNALNRTLSMAHKFVEGIIPDEPIEAEALAAVAQAKKEVEEAFAIHRLDQASGAAIELVRFLNKYIDSRAPWALAKENDPALRSVMRSMLYVVRSAEGLFRPFLPSAANAIALQLQLPHLEDWSLVGQDSTVPGGHSLGQPIPMFPRLDLQALAKEMETENAPEVVAEKPAEKKSKAKFEPPAEIDITDFMKVQLKVARILEAEAVEGSEKLVKLSVVVGEERRQILAGIKKSYPPGDLVGRQVIIVANLKPAKLMGHESQGMILAADGPDGQAILLAPEQEAPEGTSVH